MQRYLSSLPLILSILLGSSETVWAQLRMPATGTTISTRTVAGMSPSITFCNPADGKTDGLQMTVHPPLLYGAGYQRWVVEFSRVDGKPFDADRELRVQLSHGYDSIACSQVDCNVVLPQGKLVGTADFVAPKWNNAYYWSVKAFQGNRELKGLHSSINYIARVNNWGALDSSTDTLVVTPENGFDSPAYLEEHVGQLTELLDLLKSAQQRFLLLENWEAMSKVQQDRYLAFETHLPSNWLELARFGSIWMPNEALQSIQPEQLAALRQYTLGGGVLVITRLTNPNQDPGALKRFFEFPDSDHSSSTGLKWSNLAPINTDIHFTKFGMGKICTVPDPTMKIEPERLGAVQGIISSLSSWQLLRGTSKEFNAGGNYWDWLIPNIGRPPVWSFVAMIVVFAGIAGPSLLYFTTKARRASWLLFLFPALALISTILLFTYAIVHDGFDTLSRVRSFTWYDAKTNEGFAWSRQTFFSGTFLRDGLQVPGNAEVSPMNWQNEYSDFNAKMSPRATVDANRQVIRDMLPAREQRQFLLRQPIDSLKLFQVNRTEETVQVENLSTDPWKAAVFVDGKDRWWYAENIAEGKTMTFEALDKEEVKRNFHGLYRASEPRLPPGLSQGQQVSMLDFWQSGESLLSWSSYPPMMESAISKSVTLDAELQPGEFAIITESSSHIARPIPSAEESHSFHVVAGKW